MKTVSKKFCNKYFNLGKEHRNTPNDELNYILDDNDLIVMACNWEAQAMFNLGKIKDNYEVKEYYRYGELQVDPYSDYPLKSWNNLNKEYEEGVSVADEKWEKSLSGIFIVDKMGENSKISLRGIDIGVKGGDGETLILPVNF